VARARRRWLVRDDGGSCATTVARARRRRLVRDDGGSCGEPGAGRPGRPWLVRVLLATGVLVVRLQFVVRLFVGVVALGRAGVEVDLEAFEQLVAPILVDRRLV
jgi:hypothetical protein